MTRALLLLMPALLSAQVAVSLNVVRKDAVKRLFDRRVAKNVTVWVVSLENQSPDAVAVSESALLRKIPQLSPIDAEAMALFIEEGSRNSGWTRAGRVSQDLITLSAFLAASEQIKVSQPILAGLTAAAALGPYVLSRFKGKTPPLAASYLKLAWGSAIRLAPGQAQTTHIFSAPWPDDTPSLTITIDTARSQPVKLVQ